MSQMQEYEHEVELIDYIQVVLNRKWLIVGLTVFCGVVVGLKSVLATRQYQAEALVVVAQGIATSKTEGNLSATEIIVPGLAAQTYEALAGSDELITTLLDSLQNSNLPERAADALQTLTVDDITANMLEAEIVAATEKAESPLLSFRVKSPSDEVAVSMANLWVRLFVDRHQGLSSNVADDYYRRVLDQHSTAKENFGAAERELRALAASHSRFSMLERDTDVRRARLGGALRQHRHLETSLEGKKEELDFLDRTLEQVEWQGTWIGFMDVDELAQAERQRNGLTERQLLIDLRRAFDTALSDSLQIAPRHGAERIELGTEAARRTLEFERLRQPKQLRAREIQLITAIDSFRADLSRMEVEVAGLEVKSQVMQRNLADEPATHAVVKAIADEQLWGQIAEKGRVESALQEKLSEYRLITQSVNPVYQELRSQARSAIVAADLVRSRLEHLRSEIPHLEEKLAMTSESLREISSEEDGLRNELTRRSVELEERLAREALPVTQSLIRSRKALEAAKEGYLLEKEQQLLLRQEVTRLGAQFEHEKRNVQRLKRQLEDQTVEFDSLTVLRDRLASNVDIYNQSFEHFARLLEQSRIAREQAAGDIQIVSSAVIARPVPRGTVKKASVAAIIGLMASTMLAFLLEYMARAREMKQEPPSTH